MGWLLSHDDVEKLRSDSSAESKKDLCAKICGSLDLGLSADERKLASDILSLLARDVEKQVRVAVAEQIAGNPELTDAMAKTLASDVEDEVALPILQNAPALAEALLVQLLHSSSVVRQVAIAGRPDVTDQVADAIIDCDHLAAIVRLLKNDRAAIQEESLNRVVDSYGRLPPVQNALVDRPSLPGAIVEKMVALVSDSLRVRLIERYALPPQVVADIIARGQDLTSANLYKRLRTPQDDPLLFALQLHRGGRLSAYFLFYLLVSGDFDLFYAGLSVVCAIPVENARRLALDPGRQGLDRLLRKANVPIPLLIAFATVMDEVYASRLQNVGISTGDFQTRATTRVYRICVPRNDEDLDKLLATVLPTEVRPLAAS